MQRKQNIRNAYTIGSALQNFYNIGSLSELLRIGSSNSSTLSTKLQQHKTELEADKQRQLVNQTFNVTLMSAMSKLQL